ncbi:hypothetical protein AW27_015210 [Streptomyces sp. PCS3-D2]|uniref:hypothetical protein n=1 Tax=Streptomyces sp. PCS3-D2 TaxID=1460244 RepID=UPI000450F690|nr:hypothetical protein [Streptomyces sp. PCS3-D2]WKV72758.1 hypothetical protein AW27_015210 [Streptomyces sp. PCS3-D2]
MTPLALPALGQWNATSLTLTAFALACSVLLIMWLVKQRTRRTSGSRKPGSPAVIVAALAAVGCTAYSADTSWRFAAHYLDMGGTAERAAMFAAAEFALFATALLARQNLHGPKQAPGLPGTLTWVITTVQVIPAYAESGLVGGTVRAFVGPVLAAALWHEAMGIELRLRKPEAASHSILAKIGCEIRERLLSRLGIAVRDRDAAQITRDRATLKAVALATRLAELTPAKRNRWRGRRIARRLSQAVAQAAVGIDDRQRQDLLQQLAARRHATALATVDLPSPWAEPKPAGNTEPPAEPGHSHNRSGASQSREDAEVREHPDPDVRPEGPPPPSVQPPLPLHETDPTAEGAAPSPDGGGPTAQRYGRPPGADMDELLAICRPAVALHGSVTRAVLRNAVREAGLPIAEHRLTELKALLGAEQDAGTGASSG